MAISMLPVGTPPVFAAGNTVIITEAQTGAATAGDEFVELYNASASPVDITGWQLRFMNVGGSTTTLLANLSGMVPAASYYTVHSASVAVQGLGQAMTTGLSKTDKTLGLYAPNPALCKLEVRDAVAWAIPTAGATVGEGARLDSTVAAAKDKLLRRRQSAQGIYVDTNNNASDFVLDTAVASPTPSLANGATPGSANGTFASVAPAGSGSPSTLPAVGMSNCAMPKPPAAGQTNGGSAPNSGLAAPTLTELLPNPAPPQTDAADEFIELYNPGSSVFDLEGYTLEVGIATKHRFVLKPGTVVAPYSYLAVDSADTGLALSNSGGQVRLLDPNGQLLSQSDMYAAAPDSQAWALVDDSWQWTASPTPNAPNIPDPPAVAKVASATTSSKKTSALSPKAKTSKTTASKTKKAKAAAKPDTATDTAQNISTLQPRSPIHPTVLALIASSALLYGAYEYRRDLANKFYQFRANRAARRAPGQKPEGR